VCTTVPVDVDRQARQGQALDRLDDEVVVELDQWAQGGLGELTQPVADGAGRRDPGGARPASRRTAGERLAAAQQLPWFLRSVSTMRYY